MTTAIQHRPMSKILAQPAEPTPAEGKTDAPAPAPAATEQAVPDKYKGKSTEQVIEMHQNAEQRLGQIQNEVGQLRGLVTDLSAVQRPAVDSKPVVQEPVDVSGEDLIADPVGSVEKILQPKLDEAEAVRTADAADQIFQLEGAALSRDYNIDAIIATDEFQKFAVRTPGRQADFHTAATGKGLEQVRAARRLLEDFTDFEQQTAPTEKTELTPTEKVRAIATESGGVAAPISSKPEIFESDVIALINSDVLKYRSPSYQKELMAAIKEGRFVKNT